MINIDISYGELLDKISILRIKKIKIFDECKKNKVYAELNILEKKILEFDCLFVQESMQKLLEVNSDLWHYEDIIRKKIKENNLEKVAEIAILVCRTNDLRFEIKNKINTYFNSNISEVKQHIEY